MKRVPDKAAAHNYQNTYNNRLDMGTQDMIKETEDEKWRWRKSQFLEIKLYERYIN